ncbi:hypothetical protein RUM43_012088 [Polyplax serrata]|uniref:Uncharacterized protein n=1 Tax=Polyplax serrata TaxID=468196 RepID=A0AAN8NZ69_POLSC
MKYKVATFVIFALMNLNFATANNNFWSTKQPFQSDRYYQRSTLNKIVDNKMWNTRFVSEDNYMDNDMKREVKVADSVGSETTEEEPGLGSVILRCATERKEEITGDFTRGKIIIVNCFKAAIILKFLKYLTASSNSSVKLLNGLLEFVKVPDPNLCNDTDTCDDREGWHTPEDLLKSSEKEKFEYLYNKVVEKIVNRDRLIFNKYNSDDPKLQNPLSWETLKSFVNEKSEKSEEDQLRRELADPKLLSVLNTLSKNYELRVTLFPKTWMVVKRSNEDGISLGFVTEEEAVNVDGERFEDSDLTNEIHDVIEQQEARYSSDTKAKIIEQDRKGLKKKKKKIAKKAKKHLKYLLIPFTIQLALLPFFLKNLFMVAIKALLAGKAALVLIVFNLLRNAKIENENDRIRIEHYGYSQGEEYGAWINGRMLKDLPVDSK